jgi:hypothetical protein
MARPTINISERQQVVAIIFFSVVALLCAWFFLIRPQAIRRRSVARSRAKYEKSKYANVSRKELEARMAEVQGNLDDVTEQWQTACERLSSYAAAKLLSGDSVVGRIDYKHELLTERARLQRKSGQIGVELVLGMQEAVRSDGDARTLLLKLRAIESLADLLIQHKIDRVVRIAPLDPITHRDRDGEIFMTEFPLEAEFDMDVAMLYRLYRAVFEPQQLFVFRQVRVNAGATRESPLHVRCIVSALILEQ